MIRPNIFHWYRVTKIFRDLGITPERTTEELRNLNPPDDSLRGEYNKIEEGLGDAIWEAADWECKQNPNLDTV